MQISTVSVWAFASLAYFADYRKEKKGLKKDFADHMLLILLILATVIAAVSGIVFYSEPVYLEPLAEGDFLHLPRLNPPSPFALIHSEGLVLCEVLWIFGSLLQLMPKIFKRFQIVHENSLLGQLLGLLFCLAQKQNGLG